MCCYFPDITIFIYISFPSTHKSFNDIYVSHFHWLAGGSSAKDYCGFHWTIFLPRLSLFSAWRITSSIWPLWSCSSSVLTSGLALTILTFSLVICSVCFSKFKKIIIFLAVPCPHFCMGFSLVAESRGYCSGFSYCRAQAVGLLGLSSCGSQGLEHRLSNDDTWAKLSCGIFQDEEFNPCPLHWQVTLHHWVTREALYICLIFRDLCKNIKNLCIVFLASHVDCHIQPVPQGQWSLASPPWQQCYFLNICVIS